MAGYFWKTGIARGFSLVCLVAFVVSMPLAGIAYAQDKGLNVLSNWVQDEVVLANTNGLPVDHEFAAPIAAHYNWAYGATVVGVNVKGVGAEEYYAVCALFENRQLDPLSVIGPLNAPAQWDVGKYFLAAGLADGRLIVWLTAPGQYPRQLVYTNAYTPGTAFDCTVYTTDPPTAEFEKWEIISAYQYYSGGPMVAVENLDGQGNLIKGYGSISLRGNLQSIAYLDYPRGGTWVPFLLYTVVRDDRPELGNNQHLTTYSAFLPGQGGWIQEILRDSGIFNGTVYAGFSGGGSFGLLGYDESTTVSSASWLALITCSVGESAGIISSEGNRDSLEGVSNQATFSTFDAAGHQFPMFVNVDLAKIQLGHYAPEAGRVSSELGYRTIDLYVGEEVQRNGGYEPVYPITSISGTSHWYTGDPEIFWVQQGNVNHLGGQIYRLGYQPQRR